LLAIEATWAQSRATFALDAPIVRAIENALGGNLNRLVHATKAATFVDGFLPYTSKVEVFSSSPNVQLIRHKIPSDLGECLQILSGPSSHAGARGFFLGINGNDTIFVDSWFSLLGDKTDESNRFSDLSSARCLLANQLNGLQSWRAFAQRLELLLSKWRREVPDDRLFSTSSASFAFSMSFGILSALRGNLERVELAQMEVTGPILRDESLSVMKVSAGLLLTFANTEFAEENTPKDEWIEAMRLLSEISKIASLSFAADSTVRCIVGVAYCATSLPRL